MKANRLTAVSVLALGVLVGGCAAPSSELVQTGEVDALIEGDTKTWIDMVRVWEIKERTVLTGRVIQRGYGTRVPGHVDVEYSIAGTKEPTLRLVNLQRRKGLSRYLQMAAFRLELENTSLSGSRIRIRYHAKNHATGRNDRRAS